MKKLCLASVFLAFFLSLPLYSAWAQYRHDALRYTFELPGQDPSNMAMGGASVALGQDFGSFIQNPATSAMLNRSFFSLGLGSRNIRESDTYLDTVSDFNDSQTGITNFGFVFQAPTVRGSLAFGLGYTQTADFNRVLSVDAFNPFTTITDFFLIAGDDIFEPAWEAIAVDTATVNGDFFLESSWRPPFSSSYVGVDQFAEMTERGQMGEYTMFASTEFMENLFVGLALNIPAGSYSYRRTFIEDQPDIDNDYDVISIFADEEIDATIRGFNARIGAVYKFLPWLNFGASFTTPTRLQVNENFSNLIQTTFEPGTFAEADVFEGVYPPDAPNATFDYTVTRPSRFSVGMAIEDLQGFSATITAERVDYSAITLDLGDKRILERDENRLIRDELEDVINLRAGASYNIGETVRIRAGYALIPSGRRNLPDFINADRSYYSAGLGFGLADGLMLDFSLQMGRWQDENVLYTFLENGQVFGEFADEEVTRFHGAVGLVFNF